MKPKQRYLLVGQMAALIRPVPGRNTHLFWKKLLSIKLINSIILSSIYLWLCFLLCSLCTLRVKRNPYFVNVIPTAFPSPVYHSRDRCFLVSVLNCFRESTRVYKVWWHFELYFLHTCVGVFCTLTSHQLFI